MDESEVLETTETQVAEETEATEDVVLEEVPEQEEVDVEALKREKEELEKKNKQLYERLKKKDTPSDPSSLTAKDFLALKESDVKADDFDEVQDFATYKRLSIAEALVHPTLKGILRDRMEERKTSDATSTRSPRGTSRQATGEEILRRSERTGTMPESADDMTAIFLARRERQFGNNKK